MPRSTEPTRGLGEYYRFHMTWHPDANVNVSAIFCQRGENLYAYFKYVAKTFSNYHYSRYLKYNIFRNYFQSNCSNFEKILLFLYEIQLQKNQILHIIGFI